MIESAAAANIGSIMGIGYPALTGGTVQFMQGYDGRDGPRPPGLRRARRRAGEALTATASSPPSGCARWRRRASPSPPERRYESPFPAYLAGSPCTSGALQRPAGAGTPAGRVSLHPPIPDTHAPGAREWSGGRADDARRRRACRDPRALGPLRCGRGGARDRPPRRGRAGDRPAGPQRRRQVDDDAGAGRRDPADRGQRARRGARGRPAPARGQACWSATAPTSVVSCRARPRGSTCSSPRGCAGWRTGRSGPRSCSSASSSATPPTASPSGFSHGMGRRLSVVLAASTSPAVLLLDEPFDGVDPLGVEATLEVIADARGARRGGARLHPPARPGHAGLRERPGAARRCQRRRARRPRAGRGGGCGCLPRSPGLSCARGAATSVPCSPSAARG